MIKVFPDEHMSPALYADTRRVGVEIELGGLTEAAVAKHLAGWLDGTATEVGEHCFRVATRDHGEWVVELDTAWRHEIALAGDIGATVAREVIPVEIVTPPLPVADLTVLEAILARLARKGAVGSRGSVAGAYGIHFNPEEREPEARLVPVARSYAALEPWLRQVSQLDLARRALPFIDPWPQALVALLLSDDAVGLGARDLVPLYLDHVRSRNHGLDLLPILRHVDRDAVDGRLGEGGSARPAYHFRLPECRLDEPDWSLSFEWAKWKIVEVVADTPERLAAVTSAVAAARDPAAAARDALDPILQRKEFSCLAR